MIEPNLFFGVHGFLVNDMDKSKYLKRKRRRKEREKKEGNRAGKQRTELESELEYSEKENVKGKLLTINRTRLPCFKDPLQIQYHLNMYLFQIYYNTHIKCERWRIYTHGKTNILVHTIL